VADARGARSFPGQAVGILHDRILIFGNSGAGKSTLARSLAEVHALAHLDLDSFAWETALAPTRRALARSRAEIDKFTAANDGWVIEGAYADLLGLLLEDCSELVFLNPGVEACVANCRARPWEPHKYPDQAAQDRNLDSLIGWVREYQTRDDEYSLSSHRWLFDRFNGVKREYSTLS
jgi:adenylate kinase family enzyme